MTTEKIQGFFVTHSPKSMMFKLGKCAILIVIVAFNEAVLRQFEEVSVGENCETANGSQGICSFITQCPSAQEDLDKGHFPSDICGYQGTQTIICCAVKTTNRIKSMPPKFLVTAPVIPNTDKSKSNIGTSPGNRANAMCKKYSEYAYERTVSAALSITSSFSRTLECPIKTQTLIIGGELAARREFPHMVQIGYITGTETTWDCGGSLISPKFVLTAAHCLKSISKGEAKLVRAGITNQTDTRHQQTRNVIDKIKYPQYDDKKYHDIALLKLDREFDLNTYLRPACLYTQKNIVFTTAVASGWGKTETSENGTEDLLKVTLEFFTTAKCNNTYRRIVKLANSELSNGIVEDLMICAGSTKDVKDTCQGDSGGPLQLVHPDTSELKCMYDIIGITSFGIGCGIGKNIPGIYTRVSHYISWIEDIVWS